MDMAKMMGALTGKPALETMKSDEATGFKQAMRMSLSAQISMLIVAGVSLDDAAALLNDCMADAATTAKMLGRR